MHPFDEIFTIDSDEKMVMAPCLVDIL